jgi:glutathione S-transferase
MVFELVSFELCPFVQRVRVVLALTGQPYEVIYIDLVDPPPWFLDVSPLGQVPVLRISDDEALFESTAICEFLSETAEAGLLPADPLARARVRAQVALSSDCLANITELLGAPERASFARACANLTDKLDWLEEGLEDQGAPYWGGETLSLSDAAFAPLATQFSVLKRLGIELVDVDDTPCVVAWLNRLDKHYSVKSSVVDDYAERMRQSIIRRSGHAAGLLVT